MDNYPNVLMSTPEKYKERLQKNYRVALQVVREVIGDKRIEDYKNGYDLIKVSPRAVARHGCCRLCPCYSVIEVSKHLFEVEDKYMITTLIHEILHTFKDARGHDAKWKWYAKQISDHTEYTISVCSGIPELNRKFKYSIVCNNCSHIARRYRIQNKILEKFKNKEIHCRYCQCDSFKIEDIENHICLCDNSID